MVRILSSPFFVQADTEYRPLAFISLPDTSFVTTVYFAVASLKLCSFTVIVAVCVDEKYFL